MSSVQEVLYAAAYVALAYYTGGASMAWFAAGSLAVSYVMADALAPSIDEAEFDPLAGGAKQMFKSPTASRRTIYGEVATSGPILYAHSRGEANKYLYLIIGLAGHEVESITELKLDTEEIESTRFNVTLFAEDSKRAIDIYAASNTIIIKTPPLSNQHLEVGDDIELVGFTNQINTVLTVIDYSIQTVGSVDPETGGWNKDYIERTITVQETLVDESSIEGSVSKRYIKYNTYLGTATQSADSFFVNEITEWTTNHKLSGIPYIAIRLEYFQGMWLNGIPNITVKVRGKKVYDPRTTNTEWSDNWALCSLDFLRSSDYGCAALDSEIDFDAAIAAANISDEYVQINDVSLGPDTGFTVDSTDNSFNHTTLDLSAYLLGEYFNASGFTNGANNGYHKIISVTADKIITASTLVTESGSSASLIGNYQFRYACNGVIDTTKPNGDNLKDILAAGAGNCTYVQGKFVLYAGAYTVPSITITEDDIRDAISVQTAISIKDTFNAVKGVYIDANNNWEATDFPVVTNATYAAEDGEILYREIKLPLTTNNYRAQRLAKILLERGRQEIAVTLPCKLSLLNTACPDTVQITLANYGWDQKVFKAVKWSITQKLGIDIQLREEAAEIYDWNLGDATLVDIAPNSTLPNPFETEIITGLQAVSGTDQLIVNGDGTVVSRVYLFWDVAAGYTTAYEVQYKPNAADLWVALPSILDIYTAETYVVDVKDAAGYDFRVRTVNELGYVGDWNLLSNHTVVGKSAAPSDVDSYTVNEMADGTREYSWIHTNPETDVRTGGGYVMRYSLNLSATWDQMTELHQGFITDNPYESNTLAAGEYLLGIKTIDSTGNLSSTGKYITLTLGNPRLRAVLLQEYEHIKDWPGTLTSCWNDNGVLRADATQTIAALPSTISALSTNIETLVTNATSFSYTTPEFDLGADTSYTPLLSAVTNGVASFEMQVGTEAQGTVQTPWISLANIQNKRYCQFKVTIDASLVDWGYLQQFTITLDGDEKIEFYEDIDISTEAATWFNKVATGHFQIGGQSAEMVSIVKAQITAIQGVGAGGWTSELINKNWIRLNGVPISVTNLALNTEDFSLWSITDSPIITSNVALSPDGTLTADEVEDDNNISYESIYEDVTISTSDEYTASIYVKKDNIPRTTRFCMLRLQFSSSTIEKYDLRFDTSTGEYVASGTALDAGVDTVNGYWRLYITAARIDTGNTSARLGFYPAVGASATWAYAATATGDCIVWGAQLVKNSEPLPYAKNGGTVVTQDIMTEGEPAAEFKIYNPSAVLADPPLLDIELKGPKK